MDAFSCTPAVRSRPLALGSLKPRQQNVKLRNANNNGGSIADIAPAPALQSPSPLRFFSPLRPFLFGKRNPHGNGSKDLIDSDISLEVNPAESLDEIRGYQREEGFNGGSKFSVHDCDDEDCESGGGIVERNEDEDLGASNEDGEHGNWVVRILEMRSFWRHKSEFKSEQVTGNVSSDWDCAEEDGDRCCECCYIDPPMLQVPESDVKHDRNSFSRFLHRVSLPEIKFFSQLSYLCNLAYRIPDIKPGDLVKNHSLHFITSSLEKKKESACRVKEVVANDKSSGTSCGAKSIHNSEVNSKSRLAVSPAAAYKIAAAAASYLHSQTKYLLPFKRCKPVVENSVNKTKLAGEADKTNEIDGSLENVATSLNSTAVCEYELMMMDSSTENLNANDISGLSKSEVASYIATSSMTAVVAAEEETRQAVANDLQSIHSSPCEWFICDDEDTPTRLFVIQGSDSLASWQANLFFEPIRFEGLEVLVHRGIYEAAKGIYEQILTEVYAHLKKYGDDGLLRFTGHSLGGSLSVLVNLMLLIRGVVPKSSLLPVITFGSPCIMCGGDHLLKKLGLSTSHIQSIMMHRDIVPRAFSCHYPDHVAEILKRLNANFRKHPCLDNLGLLYAPLGQLLILQPDDKVSPSHPLLPFGSGLYILRHMLNNESENGPSREVQVQAAQMAFLNSPHPLETLSDPGAYGSDGSILRDHDSRNYLRTLKYVHRQEEKHRRRLLREQRRQKWWPLVVAESSMLTQRSSGLGVTMNSNTNFGAVSTIDSIPCTQVPRQSASPLRVGIIFKKSKYIVKRFARLIASQHMQMGVLFLLSARMLIVGVCTKIYS